MRVPVDYVTMALRNRAGDAATRPTSLMTDSSPNPLISLRERLVARSNWAADGVQRGIDAAERLVHRVRPEPAEGDWRWLVRPALIGFLALCAIAIGGSFSNSPFKLEMPGTWPFGVPTANTAATDPGNETLLMLGLLLVYGGLVLLLRVWLQLAKALRNRPGVPLLYLGLILALWLIPMLVTAPMFSRDVFSYAAQGEMVSHHINPYIYGPFTLGAGPYVSPVDPLWGNTPAPYGPLFLMIDGFFASITMHTATATVMALRVLELAAVVLLAYCIPKLARTVGRDPGEAFVFAVLNPLVIISLVGSAHNDALMVALLVAGLTASRLKHPVWGIVLCALAAAVKAPAALGILYIAWAWLGEGTPIRQRVRPVVLAGLLSAGVLAALTAVSGLGLGWVKNLATPGTVRSWAAPATALGMAFTGLSHAVGWMVDQASVLSVTRSMGLLVAVVAGVWLLKESDRIGQLTSLGLTLLLFVILGPVVQPWYLSWGLILLAPVARGKIRTTIIVLSVAAPFIGLPGGREMLVQLLHADPLVIAISLVALLIFVVAPLGRWTMIGRRDDQAPEPTLVGTERIIA